MPSITIWTRLEPQAGTMLSDKTGVKPDPYARALQAQIRDPLWLLARQWQTGEFLGDDGGCVVQAAIRTQSAPLTSYRPGLAGAAAGLDASVPLEVHVEREPFELGLRGAVQLGARFAALLEEAQLPARLQDFLDVPKYQVSATQPPGELEDEPAAQLRSVLAGRVVDGNVLYETAAKATNLGNVPPLDRITDDDERDQLIDVLTQFVAYRQSLYSEPAGDPAWAAGELAYQFSAGSESQTGNVILDADRFAGGHLDWYSFSQGPAGPLAATPPVPAQTAEWTFLPNHLRFRGMPNPRWWTFEDGQTDFGSTDVQTVDLAKLLVIEFALISGDEWFQLPLPLELGTLSRVTLLVATDTFGVRTVIRPTSQSGPAGAAPWSMFTIAGPDGPGDFLLLPPALDDTMDGAALEDTLFLRDDMAAMAWAVERQLPGPLDASVDGYASWRRRLAEEQPQPSAPPDAPHARYRVSTDVPDNWIPLVPISNGPRSFVFRRGVMEKPDDTGTPHPVPARGVILDPAQTLYIHDEAVPRAGLEVTRYARRARWLDGETITWLARKVRPGCGEGWSGLAFDIVEQV